jgi:hypothetical protein
MTFVKMTRTNCLINDLSWAILIRRGGITMQTAGGKRAGWTLLIRRLRQAINGFSAVLRKVICNERYRPEKRYMRGKPRRSNAKASGGDLADYRSDIDS